MSIDERIADRVSVLCSAKSSNAHEYDLCVRAVRAALADPVLRGWRTIESAPRDGTEILVAFKSVGVRQVSWQDPYDDSNEYAIWCVDDNKHGPYPLRGYSEGDDTAWMPLPAPPSALKG